MRRLKRRITELEKKLNELETAFNGLTVSSAHVPLIQVNAVGGVIPIQPGPAAGNIERSGSNAVLVFH